MFLVKFFKHMAQGQRSEIPSKCKAHDMGVVPTGQTEQKIQSGVVLEFLQELCGPNSGANFSSHSLATYIIAKCDYKPHTANLILKTNHQRAVSGSNIISSIEQYNIEEMWTDCNQKIISCRRELEPEAFYQIKYEDLLGNPQSTLSQLQRDIPLLIKDIKPIHQDPRPKGSRGTPALSLLHGGFGTPVAVQLKSYAPALWPIITLQAPELIPPSQTHFGAMRGRALHYDGFLDEPHLQEAMWKRATTYEFAFATLLLTPVNFGNAIQLGDITTIQALEHSARSISPEHILELSTILSSKHVEVFTREDSVLTVASTISHLTVKHLLHWYHPRHKSWQARSQDSAWNGGAVNIAFNEIDRHILSGYGCALAVIDHKEESHSQSYSSLLLGCLAASSALKNRGLVAGDRLIFMFPTNLSGICLIESAKRLGIIYACMPPITPAQSLSD
ncbi:hypothetical protein AURANDRAFT_67482 [Aureococcus anophagefferens]|uniref:AMP-dependent synthetase/ligase domain-containing protein n=1 Tax=Aureococcus anophagefferens TaxID=44056 RepID=F0YLB0_AURAN|nr:hypothetical protein AURANDRAFT_67482 [Aureococcus anophagefferens]EGB04111.1 hypothetical protein AURANDRAFT_67482 [Aureococcus anophagefferens]|eukprot:XP_009041236.1 hypothetical protein AURANDRAFT_67482 [Aureococcus anophagefferens]